MATYRRCPRCRRLKLEAVLEEHEASCTGFGGIVGYEPCPGPNCGGRLKPNNVATCYLCEEKDPAMDRLDELTGTGKFKNQRVSNTWQKGVDSHGE